LLILIKTVPVANIDLVVLYIFGLKNSGFDLDSLLINIGDPKGVEDQAEHVHQEENQIGQNHKLLANERESIVNHKGKQQKTSIQYQSVEELLPD